jgi:hypothetical protein
MTVFKGEDSNWHTSSCQATQMIFISHCFNENYLSLVSYIDVLKTRALILQHDTVHPKPVVLFTCRLVWGGQAVDSYLEVLVRMSAGTLAVLT